MYLFRKKVSMYYALGINFRDHLYVPEVSERTGEPQHEREDHNHVLKRIAGSLRKGHIPDVEVMIALTTNIESQVRLLVVCLLFHCDVIIA